MRKSLEWIVVIMLTVAVMVPVAVEAQSSDGSTETNGIAIDFKDTATHWAKASIDQAVLKGYVKGYPDKTFKPNQAVTCAEFVKMLVDALHLQTSTSSEGKWYSPFIQALKDAALLRDGDLGTDWSKPLSRLEMSKLLVRGSDDSVRNTSLSDGEWLYRATTAGLIAGMEDGTLNEQGSTTRAQAVVVIERLFTKRAGGTLPVDHDAVANAAILFKGTNLEEEWGVKPIALPAKIDFGPQVDVTLDKMMVIDLDDKNAPYRMYLTKLTSTFNGSIITSNEYVVALHFNVATSHIQPSAALSFNGDKISTDAPNYQWVYVMPDDQPKGYPFTFVPTLRLEKLDKGDGWFLMAVNKDVLKADSFYKQIRIFNMGKQRFEYLVIRN